MFHLKYRRVLSAFMVSGALLAAGTSATFAQSQNNGAQNNGAQNNGAAPGTTSDTVPSEKVPADAVPSDLIEKALAGDNDALAALQAYLRGVDAKSPEAIAQRTTALIAQIGREKKDASTESLLNVIDQIASKAINLVAGTQIVRMSVDNDFVPDRALIAWDFGPADGPIAPGFERILPNDNRIGGADLDGLRRPADLDGLRRPADNGLLNDGIAGLERIEANVPDGEYRIILMTQNLGDNKLMGNPFGSTISVNGSSQTISQPSPEDWIGESVLSNRGVQNVNGQAFSAADNGFITGDSKALNPAALQRQQGGAIIILAVARNGKIIIELSGFQGGRSYLTGLMIEPAEETSDLILSRETAEALAPPELRLALEEDILAAAADVLADIDPSQGDPELVELPEPILDPEELASTAS